MITVYQLKSAFQGLLRPLCTTLAQWGVTANQVTLAALALSILYAALLCLNIKLLWLLLPVFLFIRMGLNAIDGMLAREHNMKTRLGMALNELGDVIADTALLVPFVLVAPMAAFGIVAFMLLAALTEFCGLLGFMMSGTRRYDGPMGKSDRAVATGILGVMIGLGITLGLWLLWVFLLLASICIWTCYNRIKSALAEAS